jgi:hypothetical protein
MNKLVIPQPSEDNGMNLPALCKTLARVLVKIEEKEYTHNQQKTQATVQKHNDLLPSDSDSATAQGN